MMNSYFLSIYASATKPLQSYTQSDLKQEKILKLYKIDYKWYCNASLIFEPLLKIKTPVWYSGVHCSRKIVSKTVGGL